MIGLAIFATSGEQQQPPSPVSAHEKTAAKAGDGLTTGSILFVPMMGDRCRKRLIDNATWRMRDGGEVDCTTALYPDANGHQFLSATRVEVIRRGFRKE